MKHFFQFLNHLFSDDGGFLLPEGFIPQSLVSSPDGLRLAYLAPSP
jgi:hypothetical protein